MTVYETVKSLALVPAIFVVGLAIGLVLLPRWRRTGVAVLWVTTLALYLACAPFTANRFAAWVQSVPPLIDLAPARDAEAIVVLSAGASVGPEYGGILLDQLTTVRLRYAAHLYRLLGGKPVLVSGGQIMGLNTSLAAEMKKALEEDFAVPVTWAEDRSANTGANARLSAAILKQAGIHKIVLVTHASHMPRSAELFRATGLEVVPAPTGFAIVSHDFPRDLFPRLSALETFYLAAYEAMGEIWYRIRPEPAADDDVTPVIPPWNP